MTTRFITLNTLMLGVLVTPTFAHAQLNTGVWIAPMFAEIAAILNLTVPVLLGGGLLLFIYGTIRYFIWNADDTDARTIARQYMVYALIGMVILVGLWGLVNLILFTFGLNSTGAIPRPCLPGASNCP